MKIDILTLFPEMFKGPFGESIVKIAQNKKLVEINIRNLRDWGEDKRKTVDDRPYGGGIGMILRVDILERALNELRSKEPNKKKKIILLDPGGRKFDQKKAVELSRLEHLIFIAGHYEGYDERIKNFVDEEISIGDFILTGGEIPTMAVIDSIVRLLPGVLDPEAIKNESFSLGTSLEYPQYTRPEEYKGLKVPEVLLSGNHKEIEKWRIEKAEERTKKLRPDLLK